MKRALVKYKLLAEVAEFWGRTWQCLNSKNHDTSAQASVALGEYLCQPLMELPQLKTLTSFGTEGEMHQHADGLSEGRRFCLIKGRTTN